MEETLATADHLHDHQRERRPRRRLPRLRHRDRQWRGRAARRLGRRSRAGQGRHGRSRGIRQVDRQARDDHRCHHARGAQGKLGQARARRRRPRRPERICRKPRAPGRKIPSRRRTPFSSSSRSATTTRAMGAPGFRRLIVSTVVSHVVATLIARGDRRPMGCTCSRCPGSSCRASPSRLGAALVLRQQHALAPQLGALPARRGVLPLGAGHLGTAARRTAAAGPRPRGRTRPGTLAVHPAHALVRDAARADRGIQANLPREANRRPARLLRQAGKSRDAALQAADGGFLGRARFRRSCSPRSMRSPARSHTPLPAWMRGDGDSCSCRSPCRWWRPRASRSSRSTTCSAAWRAYREMRTLLEASRAQIASCRTWNSLEHVVLKTERALLQGGDRVAFDQELQRVALKRDR